MSTNPSVPRNRRLWSWGGAGFAALFLGGQFASAPLENGSIPLPDAPVAEVVEYFSANTATSAVLGTANVLAGLALLFLVGRAALGMRSPGGRVGVVAGWIAGLSLAVSGTLSVVLGQVAATAAPGTVETLRDWNFWTGGVIHVVCLGLFVGLLCLPSVTEPMTGRGVRIFGLVASVPAVLSISSLLWFYASALLPLGRFSLIVWAVFAAVSLWRNPKPNAS
ncbi:hypothetical protein [Stackebrandtia nassauensis]|uniref:Integral membrane protein n=1 Tax=Stackebrandtia nassauensis (strain DSM 44728 / CIP 108903 / NRRL B-16338 / NBRC 102104 / LLR-40K-21) TaxID=446470 RepID=D3Q7X5_STANL|nr:hypothetical protein [Stackebrandtia nassauensis]ADD40480.1 hypothetical protein Snas_0768 [Stackebrandtia nassauensis DSM 44728]